MVFSISVLRVPFPSRGIPYEAGSFTVSSLKGVTEFQHMEIDTSVVAIDGRI